MPKRYSHVPNIVLEHTAGSFFSSNIYDNHKELGVVSVSYTNIKDIDRIVAALNLFHEKNCKPLCSDCTYYLGNRRCRLGYKNGSIKCKSRYKIK
jgi:hypothetical protein